MLQWTGERFLPWAREARLAYEHLHRYAWACEWVKGKRVADLASGEGYGAAMLAAHAASAVGVDLDGEAAFHAARKYRLPNLTFLQASILQLPLAAGAFDAVICFEAIEHVQEQEQLLTEVKRLLKPEGLFVVSTPNKALYRQDGEDPNPFHTRELSLEEFDALLGREFKHRRYFHQRVMVGSSIWNAGVSNGAVREFRMARRGAEFQLGERTDDGVYVIAVASNSESHAAMPVAGSVLIDDSSEFLNETIGKKEEEIRALGRGIQWVEKNNRELEQMVALQAERLNEANRERGRLQQELAEIRQSRGWKLLLKLRRLRAMLRL